MDCLSFLVSQCGIDGAQRVSVLQLPESRTVVCKFALGSHCSSQSMTTVSRKSEREEVYFTMRPPE